MITRFAIIFFIVAYITQGSAIFSETIVQIESGGLSMESGNIYVQSGNLEISDGEV